MGGKFRVACHLIVFGGEQNEDLEKVLRDVAEAGYDGVEGINASSLDELVDVAKLAARYGLHIVNLGADEPKKKIDYNVLLGNSAVEIPSCGRSSFGGINPTNEDFKRASDSLKELVEYAQEYYIKPFHHAHRGTMIETVVDAVRLLSYAPGLYLLLDTGHLLAGRSNPADAIEKLGSRISHVHLKDFYAEDPENWDNHKSRWGEEGRFEELGKGNMGLDVKVVLEGLERVGYDGWISIEQDAPTHHPPAETAKVNREYLRSLGY